MYVCMHVCTCVCVCVYVCVSMYVYVRVCETVCAHALIYMFFVCVGFCISCCARVLYVFVYMLVFVCVYLFVVCMCVFIRQLGSPFSVVANELDCLIVVSEFELKTRYHVHFQTNTLGKGMNLLIFTSYDLNSTTTVLLQGWLRHYVKQEGWYDIKQINGVCVYVFICVFMYLYDFVYARVFVCV